jgi:XTP/dITP diphosphohydrolase
VSQPLLFVSSNPGKVREVEAILGFPIEQLALDLPEIQQIDVEAVVREKARAAYAAAGRPVVVEDTGLFIDALNGLPGALGRWFLKTIGPEGICNLIPAGAERGALARTAVALCDGETVEVLTGEVRGEIVASPRGDGGFGWDSTFQPAGSSHTFAEMDQEEKNRFSMRRQALDRLKARLGQPA